MSTTSWGAWGVPDCIFPLSFLWKEPNLCAPRPLHDRAKAQLSRMLGWDTSIHTPGPNDNTHVDKCTVTRKRRCVVLTSAPGNSTEQSLRYPVKSCNYPGAVRCRDGWEQQNQSRSNKRSSDHLWQMEARNLSLFWRFMEILSLQGKAQAKLIFPAVGGKAIARWGGQQFPKHVPPRQQEKCRNKVCSVQTTHLPPICFPIPSCIAASLPKDPEWTKAQPSSLLVLQLLESITSSH